MIEKFIKFTFLFIFAIISVNLKAAEVSHFKGFSLFTHTQGRVDLNYYTDFSPGTKLTIKCLSGEKK